jgi:hypothetical protein
MSDAPVLRRHREEAAALLGFEPATSGSLCDVYAHRWIIGTDVPAWWFEQFERGERLPIVAAALAGRDYKIRALELGALQSRLFEMLPLPPNVVAVVKAAQQVVASWQSPDPAVRHSTMAELNKTLSILESGGSNG